MRRLIALAVCAAAGGWGFTPNVQAGTIRDDRTQQQYLDLGASSLYASVGRVDGYGGGGSWIGSGTLIGSDWMLTAAHVVSSASSLKFTIGGASYSASNWVMNPNWTGNLSNGYDIALVHLSAPVTNVSAAKIYTGSAEAGQVGTYVGYGMTGTGKTGATSFDGRKRAGQNTIDVIDKGRVLLADFDNPTNIRDSAYGSKVPLNLEYAIAPGDSGGGMFITVNGVSYLAGVNSFTGAFDGKVDSDYGDIFGVTRVSAFATWINSIVNAKATTTTVTTLPTNLKATVLATDVAVPEPASLTLLGLLGLMVVRRR